MRFHDPRCAPTPISPVPGITYLQGLGLRPWAQSVLSAAGAATSSASPAAPLAASRRIRAETSPCAPPGGGAPRHPACASPRHSLRARNGDQEYWRRRKEGCSARPRPAHRDRFAEPGREKPLLSLLTDPRATLRTSFENDHN